MSIMHQRSWSGKNVPNWVAIVRVVLGVCLIYKGIDFIQNKDQLESYFMQSSLLKNLVWSVDLLPWIHIIGGIFILVGFFTRFWSLIQIPIVLGAVVFVNITETAKVAQSELPLSFLILVLVIIFYIEGGGYMSLDNYIRKPLHDDDREESIA